ncbi:MAG: carboxypeptidase-like regulatory domain-containing protein [Edaphobacter sp.]
MRIWAKIKDQVRAVQGCDTKVVHTGDERARVGSLVSLGRIAAVSALFALATAQNGFSQATASPLVADLPDAPRLGIQTSATGAPQAPAAATGSISGAALDTNGGPLPGAQIILMEGGAQGTRKAIAGRDGAFSFTGLPVGLYRVAIESPGMETYLSAYMPLHAEEALALPKTGLRIGATKTTVNVVVTQEQVAQEQIKEQEKQRVLGVFPNFYTSYIWKAAPMTRKQKYKLALRATIDPITFLTVAGVAGGEQISNTFPGYGGGPEGYAKRYGTRYADTFSSRMIGSAILPSLLHQDPRYFYRGTGSIPSRMFYAMSAAFITRGDNGRRQPNYSHVLGNLAAGGISNLYRPNEDRGVALTFESAIVAAGADAVGNLVREFVLRGFTPSVPGYANGKK